MTIEEFLALENGDNYCPCCGDSVMEAGECAECRNVDTKAFASEFRN